MRTGLAEEARISLTKFLYSARSVERTPKLRSLFKIWGSPQYFYRVESAFSLSYDELSKSEIWTLAAANLQAISAPVTRPRRQAGATADSIAAATPTTICTAITEHSSRGAPAPVSSSKHALQTTADQVSVQRTYTPAVALQTQR